MWALVSFKKRFGAVCCYDYFYVQLSFDLWEKMPSTYSKRWKKRKINDDPEDLPSSEGKPTPGGPLRRSSEQSKFWDEKLGHSLDAMPTDKLPSIKKVLRRYRCLRIADEQISGKDIAVIITDEILPIWNKAKVPTASRDHCIERVRKAIDKWYDWQKHRYQSFPDLEKILDLKPKPPGRGGNEEKELEYLRTKMREAGKKKKRGGNPEFENENSESDWEDDYEFYLDQYHGIWSKSIGGEDTKLSRRERKQAERYAASQSQSTSIDQDTIPRETSPSPSSSIAQDTYNCDTIDNDASSGVDSDVDFSCDTASSSKKSDWITISLPRKDLLRETTELSTRLGLSAVQQVALTAKLVKLGGGDLNDVTLSKQSALRHRKETAIKKESSIKAALLENLPHNLILHWDGKDIVYKSGPNEDRLCIKISFPGVDKADQFLAAPITQPPDGLTMSLALLDTLESWHIPTENFIGMSWDTTASNTGVHKGAAVRFERLIKKAILWLACRHHMGERHITHPNIAVRGPTKGPDDPLFLKFKKKFEFISRDVMLKWQWPEDPSFRPQNFLVAKANEVFLDYYDFF